MTRVARTNAALFDHIAERSRNAVSQSKASPFCVVRICRRTRWMFGRIEKHSKSREQSRSCRALAVIRRRNQRRGSCTERYGSGQYSRRRKCDATIRSNSRSGTAYRDTACIIGCRHLRYRSVDRAELDGDLDCHRAAEPCAVFCEYERQRRIERHGIVHVLHGN